MFCINEDDDDASDDCNTGVFSNLSSTSNEEVDCEHCKLESRANVNVKRVIKHREGGGEPCSGTIICYSMNLEAEN